MAHRRKQSGGSSVGEDVHVVDALLPQSVLMARVLHCDQLELGRDVSAPRTEEARRATCVWEASQLHHGLWLSGVTPEPPVGAGAIPPVDPVGRLGGRDVAHSTPSSTGA